MSIQLATKAQLDAVSTGQASAVIGYATLADLEADLEHPEGAVGYVTNDPTATNNGTYRKVGASGAGEWEQSSFDRVALVENDVSAMKGGSSASDQQLKDWTEAESYEPTSITRDDDGVVTEATVKWPDGSAGTFATTTKNTSWLAVDAYTITHTDSGKTVTQAAVTRDTTTGAVTTKPALTVS